MQLLVATWVLAHGDGTVLWLPAFVTARILPKLIAAPFAGLLADRVDRLTLVRVSRTLSVAPPVGLAMAAAHIIPPGPGMVAVAGGGALVAALDQAARTGLAWDVGRAGRGVLRMISLSTACNHGATLLTPALSVMIAGTIGSTAALGFAAGCAALALLGVWRVRPGSGLRPAHLRTGPDTGGPFGGFHHLARHPDVLVLLLLTNAPGGAVRVLAAAMPLVVSSSAYGAWEAGAAGSAPAVGAAAAAFALTVLGDLITPRAAAMLGTVVSLTSLALVSVVASVYVLVPLLALAGASGTIVSTSALALLHGRVPERLRCRVILV